MEINSEKKGQVTVVSIAGKFDATTSEQAGTYLSEQVNEENNQIVIELGGVSYLSSAGVRVMLATMQSARSAGGDLRIAGAQGNIKRVIDIAGFPKIMKVFDNVDEAVGSFVD